MLAVWKLTIDTDHHHLITQSRESNNNVRQLVIDGMRSVNYKNGFLLNYFTAGPARYWDLVTFACVTAFYWPLQRKVEGNLANNVSLLVGLLLWLQPVSMVIMDWVGSCMRESDRGAVHLFLRPSLPPPSPSQESSPSLASSISIAYTHQTGSYI